MLTTRGAPHDIATGYAAGVDRYVAKPFSPLALCALLDRLRNAPPLVHAS
jgi:DNA-binding response OmpR family regulator